MHLLELIDTSPHDDLPCLVNDPDLFFAERPDDLERAKALCVDCPIRPQCLAAALDRGEPWGVWGGEIFNERTHVIPPRVTRQVAGGRWLDGTAMCGLDTRENRKPLPRT